MAFGWDDALFAIFSAIASSAVQPAAPENTLGGEIGAGAGQGATGPGGPFELPAFPSLARTPGQTVNQTGQGVDLGPQEAVTESIAKVLAAQGPPPTVPLEPTPPPAVGEAGSPQAGPPASRAGPATPTPPAAVAPSIGEVLMSSPEALNAVANLLGLGPQPQGGEVAAPIPGGTVGNVVPGLQLPQTTNIGQLLQQIPGLR